jgi:ring-1,2-phenylacetyl-CoA epoxidase subunit PaaD
MTLTATRDEILGILAEVKDPELPMIDVVELGIVRDVAFENEGIRVDVTPTYSGCPAFEVIVREIVTTLESRGFDRVSVRTVLSPAWTTDWLSAETKQKLREHGIAPPLRASSSEGIGELVGLRRARPAAQCPFCGSGNTQLRSEFGATACKSIHFCGSCQQPFDSFKAF